MNYEQLPSDTQIIPRDIVERNGYMNGFAAGHINEGVTKIIIEDGTTAIGWGAFSDCTQITSVTIPSSVTAVEEDAFSNCTSLTEINIPDTVTYFGADPFYGTPWRKSHTEEFFVAGDGVLLKYQGSESYVMIPKNVKKIGRNAFKGNTRISYAAIPDSVTEIDVGAFCDCMFLKDISIPKSVKIIRVTTNEGAFDYTPWYDNYKDDFMIVGDGILLKYCGNDKIVTVPDNVKRINTAAFKGCSAVEEINFPDSIEYVEDFSLYDTAWYKNYEGDFLTAGKVLVKYKGKDTAVTVPNGIVTIGEGAFGGSAVESVTLPDSLTCIGNFAFCESGELEKISIPESVKTIGDMAFAFCKKLSEVKLGGADVKMGRAVFRNTALN